LATNPEYQKYWWVLVLSAITQGLIYVGTVSGIYLNAVERNRLAFLGQIIYSGTFVVVGMPATAILPGIAGPVVGGLVAAILMVIVNLWSVHRLPAVERAADLPTGDDSDGFDLLSKSASATPAA
jgi:O-antigen/teichoic acid export membrane protein